MRFLVTGASSQVGLYLRQHLVGTTPLVLVGRNVRKTTTDEEWVHANMHNDPPPAALSEVDAIISFGPMDGLANWLGQLQHVTAKRLIATSSMSAISKRFSKIAADRELSERLRTSENALAAQCERLGIAWTILRPTLIYGAGIDHNLTPIAKMAQRTRVFPLPQATGLRQPVHAEDVALAALAAARNGGAEGQVLEIGGGEKLPYLEMFQRVRKSLELKTIPISVPHFILRNAAFFLPSLRGPLDRLNIDLIANNTALNTLLGIYPRAFDPKAATWETKTPT